MVLCRVHVAQWPRLPRPRASSSSRKVLPICLVGTSTVAMGTGYMRSGDVCCSVLQPRLQYQRIPSHQCLELLLLGGLWGKGLARYEPRNHVQCRPGLVVPAEHTVRFWSDRSSSEIARCAVLQRQERPVGEPGDLGFLLHCKQVIWGFYYTANSGKVELFSALKSRRKTLRTARCDLPHAPAPAHPTSGIQCVSSPSEVVLQHFNQ